MRLSGIYIYPIKSCAGIALDRAEVALRGLANDRRYMVVRRSGAFITQREEPRLCLVKTELDGRTLAVSSPGYAELRLPRELDVGAFESHPYKIWIDSGQALRHPEGSRWFSDFLRDDVSLLYMPDDDRRQVDPERARPGDIVSFADGFPLLLISEASLLDLNARLEKPLEMRRFRPNLVIAGCAPYAEDDFVGLRIGSVTFRAVKRCARCVITTVDPETAERGREPLRTLARYRLWDQKLPFGMNLIHDGPGLLQLGDAVYGQ